MEVRQWHVGRPRGSVAGGKVEAQVGESKNYFCLGEHVDAIFGDSTSRAPYMLGNCL